MKKKKPQGHHCSFIVDRLEAITEGGGVAAFVPICLAVANLAGN